MEIEIIIRGRVTIQPDDLNTVKAMGNEDAATMLIREGREIKTEVKALPAKVK